MKNNHCNNVRDDAMECLKRGHHQLAPGVYVCSEKGHLHINGPEVCLAAGYAPTAENINRLIAAAHKVFNDQPLRVVE